jgi:MFS family permease
MALIFAFFGIGITIGPPIGGVLARNNWCWVFYFNLPIGGLMLVL